jgi:hypothetical protein
VMQICQTRVIHFESGGNSANRTLDMISTNWQLSEGWSECIATNHCEGLWRIVETLHISSQIVQNQMLRVGHEVKIFHWIAYELTNELKSVQHWSLINEHQFHSQFFIVPYQYHF